LFRRFLASRRGRWARPRRAGGKGAGAREKGCLGTGWPRSGGGKRPITRRKRARWRAAWAKAGDPRTTGRGDRARGSRITRSGARRCRWRVALPTTAGDGGGGHATRTLASPEQGHERRAWRQAAWMLPRSVFAAGRPGGSHRFSWPAAGSNGGEGGLDRVHAVWHGQAFVSVRANRSKRTGGPRGDLRGAAGTGLRRGPTADGTNLAGRRLDMAVCRPCWRGWRWAESVKYWGRGANGMAGVDGGTVSARTGVASAARLGHGGWEGGKT